MTNEELVNEYQAGDKAAIEQLYLQNSGMIERIIQHYQELEELDDLRQESYFAIMRAAELWKPDKGANFITYAAFWIRSWTKRYIDTCGRGVRLPVNRRAMIGRYYKVLNNYRMRFGRDPSGAELCALLDMKPEQLKEIMKDARAARIRSTSEPIGGEDDDLTLEDTLEATGNPIEEALEQMQHEQLTAELWKCVEELNPQQAVCIRGLYKEGKTLKQCGADLCVSVARAGRIKEKALMELGKPRYTKRLLPYLSDEMAHTWGLRCTGYGIFERSGSVQERAMMKLEELAGTNLYYGVKSPIFGDCTDKMPV